MMLLRVQRSGRTRIRATTRSGSASVKVTPFNSANGIFIDWIFSSAVFCGPVMDSPLVFPTIRSENGLAKLGPDNSGRVNSGQVNSGQVNPTQVDSTQVNSTQVNQAMTSEVMVRIRAPTWLGTMRRGSFLVRPFPRHTIPR